MRAHNAIGRVHTTIEGSAPSGEEAVQGDHIETRGQGGFLSSLAYFNFYVNYGLMCDLLN